MTNATRRERHRAALLERGYLACNGTLGRPCLRLIPPARLQPGPVRCATCRERAAGGERALGRTGPAVATAGRPWLDVARAPVSYASTFAAAPITPAAGLFNQRRPTFAYERVLHIGREVTGPVGRPRRAVDPEREAQAAHRLRARYWKALERPATITPDDWQLLRWKFVERKTAPEIVAQIGRHGTAAATAMRQRLHRLEAQAAAAVPGFSRL